jgi:hypothetical protein
MDKVIRSWAIVVRVVYCKSVSGGALELEIKELSDEYKCQDSR